MIMPLPLFACLAGNGSRELEHLLYVIIAIWFSILALACVNLVLICITGNRRFKMIHLTYFTGYASAALYMRYGAELFSLPFVPTMILGVSIPIAVIYHFFYLLWKRDRLHSKEDGGTNNDASQNR
jgi:hypothetical protein